MQSSEATNGQTCLFSWVRAINCKLHLTPLAREKPFVRRVVLSTTEKLNIFSWIEWHFPLVSTTPLWWQKSLAFLSALGWWVTIWWRSTLCTWWQSQEYRMFFFIHYRQTCRQVSLCLIYGKTLLISSFGFISLKWLFQTRKCLWKGVVSTFSSNVFTSLLHFHAMKRHIHDSSRTSFFLNWNIWFSISSLGRAWLHVHYIRNFNPTLLKSSHQNGQLLKPLIPLISNFFVPSITSMSYQT